MDSELIRAITNGLRYRPLEHLFGRVVVVQALDRVEEAVRLALGSELPADCRLSGPDHRSLSGSVVKYGILDLDFSAPVEWLTGETRSGMSLLRELGFLPGGEAGPQHRVCDDPTCLEMLQEEIAEGQVHLRLFLQGEPSPEGNLPRSFRITDACVTNAAGVWLWKHFYL